MEIPTAQELLRLMDLRDAKVLTMPGHFVYTYKKFYLFLILSGLII